MAKTADNRFKTAVEATPDIKNCYNPGLRALGGYRNKIELTDGSLCGGSVDIDACTTAKYPNSNRWDYCICYNNRAYFVEVHSANTSEVSTVIRKLQWLKDWLNTEAPELNKIKAQEPYYWIRSGKYAILSRSTEAKIASRHGIEPIGILKLK